MPPILDSPGDHGQMRSGSGREKSPIFIDLTRSPPSTPAEPALPMTFTDLGTDAAVARQNPTAGQRPAVKDEPEVEQEVEVKQERDAPDDTESQSHQENTSRLLETPHADTNATEPSSTPSSHRSDTGFDRSSSGETASSAEESLFLSGDGYAQDGEDSKTEAEVEDADEVEDEDDADDPENQSDNQSEDSVVSRLRHLTNLDSNTDTHDAVPLEATRNPRKSHATTQLQMLERSRNRLILKQANEALTPEEEAELAHWEDMVFQARLSVEDAARDTRSRRLHRGLPSRFEDDSTSEHGRDRSPYGSRKRKRGEEGDGDEAEWISSRLRRREVDEASQDGDGAEQNERLAGIARLVQPCDSDHLKLWGVWDDKGLYQQLKSQLPQGFDTRRRGTQAADLQLASQVFGPTNLKESGNMWQLSGMVSELEGYQLQVVSWMVQRERANGKPSGGVIADDPGTGKTVMSLACIASNPITAKDPETSARATLVVVPSKEVADQWLSEIKKHCGPHIAKRAGIHSAKHPMSTQAMKNCQIVITTYTTIRQQFPSRTKLRDLSSKTEDEEDQEKLQKLIQAETGSLFSITWHRIILDEAHVIKNIKSNAALSCCGLRATHYWALSGTPLSNSIEELYPYLAFIGYPLTASPGEFTELYDSWHTDPIVSLSMFRRTMSDDFLGRRLVHLPAVHKSDLWIPLSRQEKLFYSALEIHYDRKAQEYTDSRRHTKQEMRDLAREETETPETAQTRREMKLMAAGGTHPADGTLLDVESTEGVDEMESQEEFDEFDVSVEEHLPRNAKMMRFRQATSHLLSLKRLFRREMLVEDIADLKARLNNITDERSILDQVQGVVRRDKDDISKYRAGIDILRTRMPRIFTPNRQTSKLLTLANNDQMAADVKCKLCRKSQPPKVPMRSSSCEHIFCSNCLLRLSRSTRTIVPKICPYPDCDVELFIGPDFETICCVEAVKHTAIYERKHREPGQDFNGVCLMRKGEGRAWFYASTAEGLHKLPPGAKVTAAMAVLLTWQKDAPQDKIIVFTQFVLTGKVLGILLREADVPFVYFYGDMSDSQKSEALKEFKENGRIKVLLASIQCGGQSLNLAVANRVIIVDPFFHKTLENQALGRVVRRGQKKETYLVRIFAEDTIDERIFDIQEYKHNLIRRLLQDDGHQPDAVNDKDLHRFLMPQPSTPREG